MKPKLLLIFSFLIIYGCGQLEFVYNTDISNPLYLKTFTQIEGSEYTKLKSFLNKKIGRSKEKAPYYLLITSKIETKNIVVKKNQTATKQEISLEINYQLTDREKNCLVYKKDVTSSTTYNSKSAGYSFGSDAAIKEITNQAIKENVNTFLDSLRIKRPLLGCGDED